jgi:hypothetical protein
MIFSAATIRASRRVQHASNRDVKEAIEKSIFDEKYRVVAVQGDRLLLRGIRSGEVLTIINPEPETFLNQEDYPPGKLIALTDPSTSLPN